MKYLKTFAGLFVSLYVPFLAVAAIVLKPKDPNMTQMQAAMASALPFAILMSVVALGFTGLTYVMDVQKKHQEAADLLRNPVVEKPKTTKKKKRKK